MQKNLTFDHPNVTGHKFYVPSPKDSVLGPKYNDSGSKDKIMYLVQKMMFFGPKNDVPDSKDNVPCPKYSFFKKIMFLATKIIILVPKIMFLAPKVMFLVPKIMFLVPKTIFLVQ